MLPRVVHLALITALCADAIASERAHTKNDEIDPRNAIVKYWLWRFFALFLLLARGVNEHRVAHVRVSELAIVCRRGG